MIAPALAQQIGRLRAQADARSVPEGLLAWWGPTDFPDGVERVPTLAQADWECWYGHLQQAALPGTPFTPLAALKSRTAALRPDAAVPVWIADFALRVPTDALHQRVRACAAAGRALPEPLPPLAACLAPRHAYFAGVLLHEQWGVEPPAHRGLRVVYDFDPERWLTQRSGPPPAPIDFDPGDGRGVRRLGWGDRVEVDYPAGTPCAVASVGLRVDGRRRIARFGLPLSTQPAAPAPDLRWPLVGADGSRGHADVYLAHGQSRPTQPILIAEGFPGGYASDYLYDLLNQHGTADAWRAAGHALIVVGLADGLARIEANAQVMRSAIEALQRACDDELVVGGVSMGGLVARYALAEMEAQRRPHRTRILLTIDTPHRGAYTNVCDQWFAHFFKAASPAAALNAFALDSTSNQQFMSHWLHGGQAGESPLRTAFRQALAAVGDYPQTVRRLAVACGSGDGRRVAPPLQPALRWRGNAFAAATLYTLPEGDSPAVVAEGQCLLADSATPARLELASAVGWEGAPGGQNTYTANAASIARGIGCGEVELLLARNSSVPTVSALDIDTSPFAPVPPPGSGASPFDDYICCDSNQLHLQFTPAVRHWLLDRLAVPTPSPPRTGPGRPMSTAFDPSTFDPHAPAFLADPYPTYAQFREHAPVHRLHVAVGGQTLYDSHWVFRHADVKTILDDTALFVKNPSQPTLPPGPFGVLAHMPSGIFSMDPPRHDQLRALLDPLFAQAIEQAPEVAQDQAAQLIAAMRKGRRIELVNAYANPLPSAVLMTVLGLPQAHWGGVEQWVTAVLMGNDFTAPLSARAAAGTCAMALGGYFQALIRGCPAHAVGRDGMLPLMVAQAQPQGMSAVEIQQTAINFAVAGYLSTVFLIATGTLNLLRHPDQLALLRSRPELMPGAVEELLRFDAPAQLVDRYVARDTELGGVALPKDTKVTAVLGSANRDPAAFAGADALDITRGNAAQLAFGEGIHHCIGAPLVRRVAPVAFAALIDAFPKLALDGLPQWQTDPYLRSVSNLPLAIG